MGASRLWAPVRRSRGLLGASRLWRRHARSHRITSLSGGAAQRQCCGERQNRRCRLCENKADYFARLKEAPTEPEICCLRRRNRSHQCLGDSVHGVAP